MPKILDQVVVEMNFQVKLDKKSTDKVEADFEESIEEATKDGIIKGNKKASNTVLKDTKQRLLASQKVSNDLRKKQEKEEEKRRKERERKQLLRKERLGRGLGFVQTGATGGVAGLASSAGPIGAAIAAVVGAILLPVANTMKKAVEATEEQLNVADKLATRAAQSGMSQKEFLKIQKLMEFNDVESDAASQSIIEFSKRRGDPGQAELFKSLGITKDMSEAEAFLTAVSIVQNAKGSQKNALADKLFGGLGTEQLGEFLTGNLAQQSKEIQNIDFDELDKKVSRGSSEQAKLTRAQAQRQVDMLMAAPMDADVLTKNIEKETQRDIESMQAGYNKQLADSAENTKDVLNDFSVAITKSTAAVLKFGDDVGSKSQSNFERNQAYMRYYDEHKGTMSRSEIKESFAREYNQLDNTNRMPD